MRLFIISALAICLGGCLDEAQNCGEAVSSKATVENDIALKQTPPLDYQSADKALNRVYQQITTLYAGDEEFLVVLRSAQRAWIAFRDAEYNLRYPGDDKYVRYGSAHRQCGNAFLAALTVKRIAELEAYIRGSEEGDICSGSIMPKQRVDELSDQ